MESMQWNFDVKVYKIDIWSHWNKVILNFNSFFMSFLEIKLSVLIQNCFVLFFFVLAIKLLMAHLRKSWVKNENIKILFHLDKYLILVLFYVSGFVNNIFQFYLMTNLYSTFRSYVCSYILRDLKNIFMSY